jgi:hypothetical protein
MSVLLSGLPPAGGFELPPNKLVMRRMNVLLPQPLSAARPIKTVFCFASAKTRTPERATQRGAGRLARSGAFVPRSWNACAVAIF